MRVRTRAAQLEVAEDNASDGTDYNEDSIRWCQRTLRFAEFVKNDLHPPLRWPDEKFTFVYACSVFTHLEESLQHAWMRELRRS